MITLTPGKTHFLDDRSKDDRILLLSTILWSDNRYTLCEVERASEPLLVSMENGRVLNSNYDSWYATDNIENAIERLKGLLLDMDLEFISYRQFVQEVEFLHDEIARNSV